jgi:hypothetical protein
MIAMCQINLKKSEAAKNDDEILQHVSAINATHQTIKKCNHRNENGWCNKTHRECSLLKSIIIHH